MRDQINIDYFGYKINIDLKDENKFLCYAKRFLFDGGRDLNPELSTYALFIQTELSSRGQIC